MANIPQFEFTVNSEKDLAALTLRNYKRQLNKITKISYLENEKDTSYPVVLNKQDLLRYSSYVTNLIRENITNRQMLCVTYSAIFYALGRQDFTKDPRGEIYTLEFRKVYYSDEYKEKLRKDGKFV